MTLGGARSPAIDARRGQSGIPRRILGEFSANSRRIHLRAVAVVHIEVNDGDARDGRGAVQRVRRANHHVVEDAESCKVFAEIFAETSAKISCLMTRRGAAPTPSR